MTKPVRTIIKELEETNSRNEKISILESVKASGKDQEIKKALVAALDPQIDYYVKEFEIPESYSGIVTLESMIGELYPTLGKRVLTGNMARKWVTMQMELMSEEDAEIFKRIVKRDLRCGVQASTVNKIWPGLIYDHPYMRCSGFSDKTLSNIKFPCLSQTKMDAQYVDIFVGEGKVEYRSRSGTVLPLNEEGRDKALLDHHTNSKNSIVIQGEAIALDESGKLMERSPSNGYVNSSEVEPERVVFYVWDVVSKEVLYSGKSSKEDYKTRFETLEKYVSSINKSWLKIVDTKICNNKDDIVEHFKSARMDGEEGTVIKDFSGLWKSGTSKSQIKIKVVFDCDLKIVDYKIGKGKHEGKLGALICESSDGIISVSVGGGYKDSQREQFLKQVDRWISSEQVACIRANDVTTVDGKLSLFLPRFVEIRKDKSKADSSDEVMAQVKSFINALDMIKG